MRNADQIMTALREQSGQVLELSDEEIDALTDGEIGLLQAEFGAHVLMHLPPRECAFMKWLKAEDPGIYDDLWEEDENLLVSLSFLQDFRAGGPGFAICELEEHSNYYFTPKHIKHEGAEALKDILRKAQAGEDLAVEEVLMFEVVRSPIDIWHFSHRYGVPLARAKEAVRTLVSHDWLVHLPRREDLLPYIGEEED